MRRSLHNLLINVIMEFITILMKYYCVKEKLFFIIIKQSALYKNNFRQFYNSQLCITCAISATFCDIECDVHASCLEGDDGYYCKCIHGYSGSGTPGDCKGWYR